MNKHVLLIICLVLLTCISVSQTLERSVIASSGFSYSGTNYIVDYTVGETFTLTVSNSNNILTQGFQQPGPDTVVSVFEITNNELSIMLYPNPASEFINLSISNPPEKDLHIEVIDMLGSILIIKRFEPLNNSSSIEKININKLPQGTYFIKLYLHNVSIACLKFAKIN